MSQLKNAKTMSQKTAGKNKAQNLTKKLRSYLDEEPEDLTWEEMERINEALSRDVAFYKKLAFANLILVWVFIFIFFYIAFSYEIVFYPLS